MWNKAKFEQIKLWVFSHKAVIFFVYGFAFVGFGNSHDPPHGMTRE
jgi:hypothetical protein